MTPDKPFFSTRGVVLTPQDLTLKDWPERARRAGLTSIALHPTPKIVREFLWSEQGHGFLESCSTGLSYARVGARGSGKKPPGPGWEGRANAVAQR